MFYVLDISDDYPDSLWCSYLYDKSPPPTLFTQAMRIDYLDFPPVFQFKKQVSVKNVLKFDYFDGGVDLISPKFAKLLEEIAPTDVQLLDAEVWVGDHRVDGFKVMNVLHAVSCIDLERSDTYHMLPNDPWSPIVVSTPVFHKGTLTEHAIARAVENLAKTIVVSDSFMEACRGAGIRGVEFKPEGQYT